MILNWLKISTCSTALASSSAQITANGWLKVGVKSQGWPHLGSECMTQPQGIFRQTPGYLPTSLRPFPTSPRLSSNQPVEVKVLDISTCIGLNYHAMQRLCLGSRIRMKMCTLWPSALSFGSSLCSNSILPEECTSRSSSDPASPPACRFTAKSSSSPLHRNCIAASYSHLKWAVIIHQSMELHEAAMQFVPFANTAE